VDLLIPQYQSIFACIWNELYILKKQSGSLLNVSGTLKVALLYLVCYVNRYWRHLIFKNRPCVACFDNPGQVSQTLHYFQYIPMVTFQSKPYGQKSAFSPLAAKAKQRPFLYFGLPFLGIMVAGSFGLSQLTQTKFDHRDRRHTKVYTDSTIIAH
jgi:hypothetical protein